MRASIPTAGDATMRLMDGLVIFWVVLWLLVGVWSSWSLWQLADTGSTVTTAGRALQSTGEALQTLGGVPVVGEAPGDLGDEVLATGREVASQGGEIHDRVRQLAITLGVAIVLIPASPVLGLYLPLRIARRRELDELRRTIDRDGLDPHVERYLAERAVHHLPYSSVRSLSDDPWRDIAAGRTTALAQAELARLGLPTTDGS